MSKYIISDCHGCYEEFLKMMDLINFKVGKKNIYFAGYK